MFHTTNNVPSSPEAVKDVLQEILREGARKMLQEAIHHEVGDYLEKYKEAQDDKGHSLAVRNGFLPEREILTGLGPVKVKQPRVDDRKLRAAKGIGGFCSQILPPYMRRIPSIDNLIPALYLRGISTGDFPNALSAILGEKAKNLSANTVVRLKAKWKQEYEQWCARDLSEKEYVYIWVDGIYFNVRLEEDRTCILVVMGADREGNKVLLGITDGFRESKLSWGEFLLELKLMGLKAPSLAIGDGALGFWAALREVYPTTREQRCWVHKTANILNKLPKRAQAKAKTHIHSMYMAETKENALEAYEKFRTIYGDKYYRAVQCLEKNKDQLFTFYDFPAVHWMHIRTTNPIESTFATVRLRTKRTKGCGSRITTLTMVFQLAREAQKRWRKLRGSNIIPLVIEGRKFIDGVLEEAA